MSAWSDWQCGAITWEDYCFECRREAALDERGERCEEETEGNDDG